MSIMDTTDETQPTVLLSTVSSDSHTWNLVYLELLLRENGFEVVNLGACVPDDLLVSTAARVRPDVVVVSSVNGHGCIDGKRVISRMRAEPATRRVPAVIGGKLGITGESGGAQTAELETAGFDVVFGDGDPADLVSTLHSLIGTADTTIARPARTAGGVAA